jgi:hypothetical protein
LKQLAYNTLEELPRRAILKRLERKDFIRRKEEVYDFCVPIFKEWILDNE